MKKIILTFILISLLILPTNIQAISSQHTNPTLVTSSLTKFINKTIQAIKIKITPQSKKNAYPTSMGQILVTPDFYKNLLPTGHSAIIINRNQVIEALSNGIVYGKNNWNATKKKVYGLQVNNVSSNNMKKVINYIKKQVGKKYNYNFYDTKTRKKFYCSQIIWAAFLDTLKINLDTKLLGYATGKNYAIVHPIELVLSNKTKVVYYHAK